MRKLLILIILFVLPNVAQAAVKSWAGNEYTGLFSEMTGTYADGSRFTCSYGGFGLLRAARYLGERFVLER